MRFSRAKFARRKKTFALQARKTWVCLLLFLGGVMVDHEYEAVFRIGRLRSLLFFSGVGQ